MRQHQPEPPTPTDVRDDDAPDHAVDTFRVTVALVVLATLLIGLFWLLPIWFRDGVVNISVRQ